MGKNITIFRPKRKYNAPRYSMAIAPQQTKSYQDAGVQVTVTNISKKMIYLRKDDK